jgi:hypothetical protein
MQEFLFSMTVCLVVMRKEGKRPGFRQNILETFTLSWDSRTLNQCKFHDRTKEGERIKGEGDGEAERLVQELARLTVGTCMMDIFL